MKHILNMSTKKKLFYYALISLLFGLLLMLIFPKYDLVAFTLSYWTSNVLSTILLASKGVFKDGNK